MSDDYLEAQRLHAEAERMRDEAFEYRAEADRKLADANYLFGQASHRHRLIADLEPSVQQREARLLNELGEAELIKREKIANEKLKQAEELMRLSARRMTTLARLIGGCATASWLPPTCCMLSTRSCKRCRIGNKFDNWFLICRPTCRPRLPLRWSLKMCARIGAATFFLHQR